MNYKQLYKLGIDIGSTTVKIAILDTENNVLFSDYERHFANIQETLSDLLGRALYKLGPILVSPVMTGSGGLTLANHPGSSFCTGSHRSLYRSSGLRTSDRCCNRARWRRCKNHLL